MARIIRLVLVLAALAACSDTQQNPVDVADAGIDVARDTATAADVPPDTDDDLKDAAPTVVEAPACVVVEPTENDCGYVEGAYFLERTELDQYDWPRCVPFGLAINDVATLPLDDPRRWLEPLANLEHISGDLTLGSAPYTHDSETPDPDRERIWLPGMTGLQGLRNLQTVQAITIWDTQDLESLDGLCNLRRVEEVFFFGGNPKLADASGLVSLEFAARLKASGGQESFHEDLGCLVGRLGPEATPGRSQFPQCEKEE